MIDVQPKHKSDSEELTQQLTQENKKIRQFDGSSATIKKTLPLPQVKELEERLEFAQFAS